MKIPLSWLKDFVDITLPLEELAKRLTMAGLEVEEITCVGLPLPDGNPSGLFQREFKITGLEWDPDKIVTAAVLEVMPHPNADRLVLCRLFDGQQEQIVLTGAPNLYPYKGQGVLPKPLKVAYAKEGSRIYDGHQPGQVLTTLKRAKIRGVDSYSMICSEKELGISEDHEGVIILDDDAPVGVPLVMYMGDAVLDLAITPNIARDANVLGVAREIAAITGVELHQPSYRVEWQGPDIAGQVGIEILNSELNPRFVLGLVRDVAIGPSPYWVQRRLKLAGMRPINSIVDATNYAMLEIGEPLHAFDYDVLVQRAGGKTPTIITRTAAPGEKLTTLDGVERVLDEHTVLVCDTLGALSIAGVMGGQESEVNDSTHNVLLEGAAWNFTNIRRTLSAQRMNSEAAYRFSRGVHPAMAERGVRRGLELMRQWSGGIVDRGLVDNYPLPPMDPTVTITSADVHRWLGIELSADEISAILERLEFQVRLEGESVHATAPDHRLDIGTGVIGQADLVEEIARIYGYDRIPETRLADELPPQFGNPALEREDQVRDLLVELGLQEVVTYHMTSPEREARRLQPASPSDDRPYVQVVNPIASDRGVLRHSLLSSLLEIVEHNARLRLRLVLFEIGPVFMVSEAGELPDEIPMLAIVLTGLRQPPFWGGAENGMLDFYDLKGVVQSLLEGLHLGSLRFEPAEHPSFHPGKTARIYLDNASEVQPLGVLGELHPLVRTNYELPETPLLVAELSLQAILDAMPEFHQVEPVPAYPPVLEDLAVIVAETTPAEAVAGVIRQAAGKALADLRLFDVYRGDQIGAGKKSLAYSLTYQAPDRTLTDQEVSQLRGKIIRRLEQELGAILRS
jgi:phenylalanyl-tRNA synthetase beta chain